MSLPEILKLVIFESRGPGFFQPMLWVTKATDAAGYERSCQATLCSAGRPLGTKQRVESPPAKARGTSEAIRGFYRYCSFSGWTKKIAESDLKEVANFRRWTLGKGKIASTPPEHRKEFAPLLGGSSGHVSCRLNHPGFNGRYSGRRPARNAPLLLLLLVNAFR